MPNAERSEYISHEHLDIEYLPTQSPTQIQVLDDRRSRHARRKHTQADRWYRDVLPLLIRPFMQFKHQLLSPDTVGNSNLSAICHCSGKHRTLGVLFVSMERLEDVVLDVCPCQSAAVQIVECGFFPCSPVYPTLAVSLHMLEFMAALFLHVAPNERAWATTVVGYLKARGHEFATGDSFQRRFSNSLAYYQILVHTVDAEMTRLVEEDKLGLEREAELDSRTPIHERTYINVQNKPSLTSSSNKTTPRHDTPSEGSPVDPIDRPSAYLRLQCPLCFGGNHTNSGMT